MTETTDIPEGYKATDLGELPEGWNIKPLSEIISFRKGRKPNNLSETPANDTVPYLTADYFRTGIPSQYVNLSKDPSAISVATDDVVFIWDGSNAGDVFPGLNGVLASTMTLIRADQKNAISDWIFYILKTHFSTFNTQTTGSTIPHVNKNLFLNLPIPLPPLPEQRAIAATLRSVQEAKEKTDAVIAATKALSAAMMKHLFTYGPVPPEEAEKVVLKETEIGAVPKNWEIKKFEDFCILQRGQDLRICDMKDGNVPVIGATAIIGYHNLANVKGPGVTVVRSGSSAGKTLYIGEDFWAHNVVMYVKDFKGNNPKFVHYKLQQLDLTQYKSGVSVPTLNRNTFSMISVDVPPKKIQDKIVDLIIPLETKLAAEQSRRQALDTLFTTLLHDLMTAKIRINTERNSLL